MLKLIRVWLLAILGMGVAALPGWASNNSGQAFSTWPDTGQTKCYDNSTEIPCPAEGADFYGQDAQYAGPSRSYTDLGNGTVQDNVTGLVWEQKNNMDGVADYTNPHDADNTYTWCDTDTTTNGGDPGTCGDHDTKGFIEQLNSTNYGGYGDWRLPTVKELATLTDLGDYVVTIDPVFAATTQGHYYWSSTTSALILNGAWFVGFDTSGGNHYYKERSDFVRAVRGGKILSVVNRFIDNDDTVTDTVTGLEWQKASMDITGDGIADTMTWKEALAAAENLNLNEKSDWRLPDKNELRSLVDHSCTYPAIDPVFAATTQGSLYWSSTNWGSSSGSGAHLVGFGYGDDTGYNKLSSFYVRAVRGTQSATSGTSGYLEMTAPQTVNAGEPFQIGLRMLDRFGQLVNSSYDRVFLTSSCGPVEPSAIDLAAGLATYPVRLFSPSAGCEIYARAGQVSGRVQNAIQVLGEWLTSGSLSGKVVDNIGQPLASATIKLRLTTKLIAPTKSELSGGDGSFAFTDLLPGIYVVWAEVDGQTALRSIQTKLNLNTGPNTGVILKVRSKKPPVVLVPGFEGSAMYKDIRVVVPLLPTDRNPEQDRIGLHNPYNAVGWNDLKEDLKNRGFEVFDCPWDWRQSPRDPDVWDKYLKKTITAAKEATGYDKVDIVAHSMGGLLTRAYIVSDEYRNDIGRFAMAGTPNHGTYLAYPVWEGGDPILCDNMKGDTGVWLKDGPIDGPQYFHSQTINRDYKKKKGTDLIRFENWHGKNIVPEMLVAKKDVRSYVRSDIPLLQTVMPYDVKFLDGNRDVSGDKSKNNLLLPDLNTPAKINQLKDSVERVKIFGSNKRDTVYELSTNSYGIDVYEQGVPINWKWKHNITGDNLTTAEGLLLDGVDKEIDKDCEHSKLIGCYSKQISDFLAADRAMVAMSKISSTVAKADVPVAPIFSLGVDGSVTFVLTGPDGKRNGVTDDGQLINESDGVEVYRTMDGMSLSYASPPTGLYQVSLASPFEDKAEVALGYDASDTGDELEVPIYVDGSQDSFTVRVNPALDPILALQSPVVLPPHDLKAVSVNGQTALSWVAPSSIVTSYRIYSRDETEAFFTLLDSAPGSATGFQTNHSFVTPRKLYVMSSVDAQGNESVLSETIANELQVITKYEYSTFPWPMFLPAITNKKVQ